jgi:DNA mismatch repair protein MSH2
MLARLISVRVFVVNDPAARLHDAEHLGRFESLLEAAVDLNRIPDEYIICASYDQELAGLQKMKDAAEDEIHAAFKEAADDLHLAADKVLKLEHNNMHGGVRFRGGLFH